MAVLESCLTVLGVTSGFASMHAWFTGFQMGNQLQQMEEQLQYVLKGLEITQSKVERLTDHILYAPSIQQVQVLKENSNKMTNLRNVKELLEPIQYSLKEDILSTAVLSTPSKLKEAFQKDPWEVLLEIRPIERTQRPTNPDLIPILFLDNGAIYIGWQLKGTLPFLFDCEYFPNIDNKVLKTNELISKRKLTKPKNCDKKTKQINCPQCKFAVHVHSKSLVSVKCPSCNYYFEVNKGNIILSAHEKLRFSRKKRINDDIFFNNNISHQNSNHNPINITSHSTIKKNDICVVGVGGAGGNLINNFINSAFNHIESFAINTNVQFLDISNASNKIQIGEDITQGLGSGSNPDIGRDCALESSSIITKALKKYELVFITASLGGGTGSGASPVIAEICKSLGLCTIFLGSLPFSFEGDKRNKVATEAKKKLESIVDLAIIYSNDQLRGLQSKNDTMSELFKMADEVLINAIATITDVIHKPGIVKLNYSDLKHFLSNSGKGLIATGIASGDKRSIMAAKQAIDHPVFENMSNAKKLFINITGNNSLTVNEISETINYISDTLGYNSNLLWGSALDNELQNKIKVSIIAAGSGVEDLDLGSNFEL